MFFNLFSISKKFLIPFSFAFLVGSNFAQEFNQKTHIVFVRHAETELNARYGQRRENVLTPKGEQQAIDLVDKLADYQFDAIYLSPKGRVQKTIEPYLRSNSLEDFPVIWNNLTECCWIGQPSQEHKAAMKGLRTAVSDIRKLYTNSGKTILIVGHSLSGAKLMQLLANRNPNGAIYVPNASPFLLEESAPGVFRRIK